MSANSTPLVNELAGQLWASAQPLLINVDADRRILQVVGDIEHYGYEGLNVGRLVDEALDFMLGIEAPTQTKLEFLETPTGRCAHIQVDLARQPGTILLLEATEGRDSIRAAQQLANEARLEHYRANILLEQVGEGLAQEGTALIELSSRAFSITQKIRVVMDELARHGKPNEDIAFQQAKAAERERLKKDETSKRLTLESDLQRALRRGEFELHYQPKQNLISETITGCEALIRWRLPDGELVAPGNFIAAAEESGIIIPIGEWVLREACKQNRAWQDAGIAPMSMAVNVSSAHLAQDNFLDVVQNILIESKLDAQWLELEITESLVMQDTVRTSQVLTALLAMGVKVSIDDFGTGYSSLSYLKRFPIDSLKIDQSFLHGLTADGGNVAIIQAIISMASSLNLRVIAEGVETNEHLALLRVLECDEIQGYLLSEPLAAQELEQFLRNRVLRPKNA